MWDMGRVISGSWLLLLSPFKSCSECWFLLLEWWEWWFIEDWAYSFVFLYSVTVSRAKDSWMIQSTITYLNIKGTLWLTLTGK